MPKVEYTSTKGLVQSSSTDASFSIDGALSKRTSETLLDWNYTTAGQPIFTNAGLGDANGALATGQTCGMLWPNNNGKLTHTTLTMVGAFTTTGLIPTIVGPVPATDAVDGLVGLNLQLDSESTNNQGCQIHLGSAANATNANKFTVGTHAGTIDATFQCAAYAEYDCIVVGFRKAEPVQTGFNGIVTGAAGDLVYTDVFVAGVVGASDDIKSRRCLNGASTDTVTDTGTNVVDSDNFRIKVSLASTGVTTFQYEVNGIAGAGTLQDPTSGTHTHTFDTPDDLVPFIAILGTNQNRPIFLKALKITRSPGILHVD